MKSTSFYDIFVPSLNEYKAFNEITTIQEKILSKSLIAEDSPYKTEFIKYLINLLKENSVDNVDIYSLTLIDCILIVLALRCYSIGSVLNLNITCNKCKAKHKVDLNLIKIYENLLKMQFSPKTFNIKNQKITCMLPTIEKELHTMYHIKKYLDKEDSYKEKAILNVNRFITSPDTSFNVNYFDDYELEEFEQIVEYIQSYNDILSSIIPYKIKCSNSSCGQILTRQLSFDYNGLYSFLKLIFGTDLNSIYKDIYYLNKIGLSPIYTESLTSLERTVFWSVYNEEQKNKKAKLSQ